jgi:hypothetical protein
MFKQPMSKSLLWKQSWKHPSPKRLVTAQITHNTRNSKGHAIFDKTTT